MDKDFVPYEEAVALKELGYDEPCFGYYIELVNPIEGILTIEQCDKNADGCCIAPTFSQAFRWFRDNFGLSGWVDESFTTNNRQGVVSVKSPKGLEYIQSPKATMFFETYEEAELACLRKLIEIVKQQPTHKDKHK